MAMLSRLELAVIAAVIFGGTAWIEHGHRIDIGPPAITDAASAAPAATCAANDNVPYSQKCLAFLEGDASSDTHHWQPAVLRRAPQISPNVARLRETAALAPGAACPDNDNVPYSARCLNYLSGWPWHANPASSMTN